ncbi:MULTISPECIES: NADP-dependent oxidoreductase [unclassified Streptomyces]|uniref:NADP-dependent oxidoreductase n=1 Tax=unclassified Streptomyces TaxID=2593676 RepID=UPI0004781F42|nr:MULTISPECIES: NADP-dependent oxidoreductase [unclassified Streptomyces]MYX35711.1 zinc-binding dehydrogenase [Streptomyces sp. SID8377]
MKTVGVSRFGGPEALRVFEVPEPHAGPGQVRIRVHAATVNPGDRYLRNGALGPTSPAPPYVPGMEAAGVLDEIGSDVETDLRLGDRVMAMVDPRGPLGGAYAQYVVLPAAQVARAPRGTTHAEAATLPMNGLTARLAVDLTGLSRGQTLAVTGAAGAVGGYVTQMAKADGLTVVADASQADEELVRSFGADIVVPRGADVAQHILRAVPGGVAGLIDAAVIGSAVVAPAVHDGGVIVTVLGEGSRAVSPEEMRRRSLRMHMAFVPDYLGDRSRLDDLRELTEAGRLTLRVASTFPPERAAEAHRLMEAGGVRGRLVLEF